MKIYYNGHWKLVYYAARYAKIIPKQFIFMNPKTRQHTFFINLFYLTTLYKICKLLFFFACPVSSFLFYYFISRLELLVSFFSATKIGRPIVLPSYLLPKQSCVATKMSISFETKLSMMCTTTKMSIPSFEETKLSIATWHNIIIATTNRPNRHENNKNVDCPPTQHYYCHKVVCIYRNVNYCNKPNHLPLSPL